MFLLPVIWLAALYLTVLAITRCVSYGTGKKRWLIIVPILLIFFSFEGVPFTFSTIRGYSNPKGESDSSILETQQNLAMGLILLMGMLSAAYLNKYYSPPVDDEYQKP
jgi:hypothetical protein